MSNFHPFWIALSFDNGIIAVKPITRGEQKSREQEDEGRGMDVDRTGERSIGGKGWVKKCVHEENI